MLEKQETYSKIEVLESGHIQLRKTMKVLDDGQVISQSHHRSVVTPLDDITSLPQSVQDVCNAYWNEDIRSNFNSDSE